MLTQLPGLRINVLAVLLPKSRDVAWCSLLEAQGRLSSIGKFKAISPRIRPSERYEVLRLLPRHALGLSANHPVNTLPIHHDVDREHAIPCRIAPIRNAMFG